MSRIVDLSLDIYDRAPTFWPDPKTAVIEHLKIANLKYNITQLIMSTHLGTHLDAPFHFFDHGRTVEKIDPGRGFGPAWVLDFSGKGPKAEITRDDLARHERKITKGARIILRTGWDKVFPEERYFTDYPGLPPDACAYLAGRGIACLALDMPSVYGPNYVAVHHALLGAEVLVVEGLAHLESLASDRVFFVALPLRIRGRDGSPCRAIAVDGMSEAELDTLARIQGIPENDAEGRR
jgi:kynurenine formamidase